MIQQCHRLGIATWLQYLLNVDLDTLHLQPLLIYPIANPQSPICFLFNLEHKKFKGLYKVKSTKIE